MFEWLTGGGGAGRATLSRIQPIVGRVNDLEEAFSALSDEALKEKTKELKEQIRGGIPPDNCLPEAFALVREAGKRTLGQRHFDVQLLGGAVLHNRGIAEMRTGEGKTLVATLPAYLNALTGEGVHVVTVNDYLSRRDAVWMGQVYSALGLSIGVIAHEESYLYDPNHRDLDKTRDTEGSFKIVHEFLRPCTRAEAYAADITYGTNSEFGFDYLRDNLEYEKERLRQRGHAFAIIDEVDSILIDEARTPLIISAPTADSEELYHTFARIAPKLSKDTDYTVDEKFRSVQLTDEGITKAEKLLGIENIYTDGGVKYVHHLETAVRAEALYVKDKEYVVKDGEVVIVDEFTGRLQPGRRWSEGLHQAIEAKESVPVQKESRTFASITYQNYFRLYKKLAGMTGTAATSSEEFYKVYGLEVVEIPTNKSSARNDLNDLIFQTETGKFKALARRVKEVNQKGQPVLIGTASIEKNELLSAFLRQEGVQHEMLNAKHHEREGEIIAQAGKKGRVTVATNMAGRGVDIKLGGATATPEEYEEIKNLGGLFVLGTERHEARRIDNQLRGRSGRQGDPGETQFYVSLEDTLMRVFASDTIKKMMGRFGIPEDEPIENKLITRSLESAQTRIEGFHFDARKHVLEYDNVLNLQRQVVYERRRKLLLAQGEDVREAVDMTVAGDTELEKQIEEAKQRLGSETLFYEGARRLLLQAVDMFWVDHLEQMDYLRSSVNLRAYGQRDPLVEYKKEGLRLFKQMEESVDAEVAKLLPHVGANMVLKEEKKLTETYENAAEVTAERNNASVSHEPKVGRNDPCPCGSGKKYKNCGLKNTEEHQRLASRGK
jgi:preprotein translocase subunit SecA